MKKAILLILSCMLCLFLPAQNSKNGQRKPATTQQRKTTTTTQKKKPATQQKKASTTSKTSSFFSFIRRFRYFSISKVYFLS